MFGFICYIQKGVVTVSCKLHQALDIVVIKHSLDSKQQQTAYCQLLLTIFFELLVPKVLTISYLIKDTCEFGHCYSGQLVSVLNLPCLTKLARTRAIGQP